MNAPTDPPLDLTRGSRPLADFAGSRTVHLAPEFLFSAAATLVFYLACGATLGLFFAGFLVATVLAPVAALRHERLVESILSTLAVALGIGLIWSIAVFTTPDTLLQWLGLLLALSCYALALAALAAAVARCKLEKTFAAAGTIFLGLLWLCWPVWLSPALTHFDSRALVGALVKIHPPLVANGVLRSTPPWTEYAIAYQLTDLDQDVPIALPGNVLACVICHGTIAAGLFGLARVLEGRKGRVIPSAGPAGL